MDLKTWDLMKLDELDVLDEIEFPLIHLSWLFLYGRMLLLLLLLLQFFLSLWGDKEEEVEEEGQLFCRFVLSLLHKRSFVVNGILKAGKNAANVKYEMQ